MKIGIITFHFACNCGAVLQCLALSEVLKQLGQEVEVINYRPEYHANRYRALKNPFINGKKVADNYKNSGILMYSLKYCKGFAGAIKSWRYYATNKEISNRFNRFVKENLHETGIYKEINKLREQPPVCDIYICGSDQIWNTALTNGRIDPAYLLDFGETSTRKISYSAGVNLSVNTGLSNEDKMLLSKFQAISLREHHYYLLFKEILKSDIEVHIDLDPSLLLSGYSYEKFMCKNQLETEEYILVYTMNDTSQDTVNEAALELSRKKKIRIIDISNDAKKIVADAVKNRICGPSEFLWYIKNARFIVTNSFHSTAFALIFNKNFVAVPHSQTGYRITELLDKLELSAQYTNSVSEVVDCFDNTIDFECVAPALQHLHNESLDYLKRQLSLS